MKYIIWNGQKMTTISEIAIHYSEGDKDLAKESKPFIRTGINKLETIKLSKTEIENNIEHIKSIVPKMIPPSGITLIAVEDVPKVKKYFSLVLEKKKKDEYKIDRYYSKRPLIEELKLELKRKNVQLTSEEFKAVLSYAAKLERKHSQVNALRGASKKFGVTQKRIKDIIGLLDLQIDYKNKPRNYFIQK